MYSIETSTHPSPTRVRRRPAAIARLSSAVSSSFVPLMTDLACLDLDNCGGGVPFSSTNGQALLRVKLVGVGGVALDNKGRAPPKK
mmetsp:Transcript_9883/g.21394  ORF Transcript_9883/g.21394 Transcript_9883/m.21394 type:complete len:86 (+) Transcript_9883:655-912(+)